MVDISIMYSVINGSTRQSEYTQEYDLDTKILQKADTVLKCSIKTMYLHIADVDYMQHITE